MIVQCSRHGGKRADARDHFFKVLDGFRLNLLLLVDEILGIVNQPNYQSNVPMRGCDCGAQFRPASVFWGNPIYGLSKEVSNQRASAVINGASCFEGILDAIGGFRLRGYRLQV